MNEKIRRIMAKAVDPICKAKIKCIEWFKWWYHLKRDLTAIGQLKALQAIDCNWHDSGRIIIMFHLDGQDIVHIVEVKRKTTMQDYIELSKRLEAEYGVPAKYFDHPMGSDMSIFG